MNFFYLQIGYKAAYPECMSPKEQEFCSPAYPNLKLMKSCNDVSINKLVYCEQWMAIRTKFNQRGKQ